MENEDVGNLFKRFFKLDETGKNVLNYYLKIWNSVGLIDVSRCDFKFFIFWKSVDVTDVWAITCEQIILL